MATGEEKKNIRSALYMLILSIIFILSLFYIGIPLIGKFTAFLSDLRGSKNNINKNDITPPAPPKFDATPDFVNKKEFNLAGISESGATLKLTFNNDLKENVADKNGKFSFNVTLNDGENTFSAIAVDQSGNESKETATYSVMFDDKPPELEVNSPSEGSNFFGSTQRQLTIKGKTEINSQITINDRFVFVDGEGNFQYSLSLSDGENKFNIKTFDRAGNSTEKELIVNFTP